MRTQSKKYLWGIFSLIIISSLLAGCGKESSVSGGNSPAKNASVITVAASQNWIVDVDRELAKKFTEETGIFVDFQLSPDDQYQTIIKSKLNTGEGPDIFMTYSGTKLKSFNPEKNMVDLSNESWVEKLEPWAIETSSYNGTLYAQNTAGIDITNGILFKRSVFDSLGISIPTTYNEFKDVSRTLEANGIVPIYEFVKDLWHTHYWMEGASVLALERNPSLYNDLNTNALGFADVPEFVTALEQLQELEALGYLGKNHMSNTYDGSYNAIANDSYGMIIIHGSYPNEIAGMTGTNPDDYGMFPSPLVNNKGATLTAGGLTKGINSNSKNIDLAKQYFTFLAQDENLKTLYEKKTAYVSSSVEGIEASPTLGFSEVMNIVGGNKQPGAEASVYFYDGAKISELIQEMFAGYLSPRDVLVEFDRSRRALARDAGQPGF